MKNVIQLPRNMNEFGYIVMIEFKFFQLKQVFNISKIPGDQVVHCDYMVTFADKPVAKMRTQESCAAGDQYPFAHYTNFGWLTKGRPMLS